LGKQAKSEALAWQLAFATQACRSPLILGAIAKRTPPTWHAQLHCIRDGASKLVKEKKRTTTTQQQLSLTRRGRQMMARLQQLGQVVAALSTFIRAMSRAFLFCLGQVHAQVC
jgi:hypothetical protein